MLINFLLFVEIRTKLASVIPFLLGTCYALYRYERFSPMNMLIMFVSLLTFDMATTAINNYLDFKKATKLKHALADNPAVIVGNIAERSARLIIFSLLAVAVVAGFALIYYTDIVVLFIGAVSFLVGVFYTFGPVPLSRMPLGEIFSGFFMGFVIFFLAIYIHIFDQGILTILLEGSSLIITVNVVEVFYIFLLSIPIMSGIANIMLANNICDLDEDIINRRFTLPYYFGHDNSLLLFKTLYYISYFDILLLVLLGLSPKLISLCLLTVIPVQKNIRLFTDNPVKNTTFMLSVQNFFMINFAHLVLLIITIVLF